MKNAFWVDGSERYWIDDSTGLIWCSIHVSTGRVTKQVNGPRSVDAKGARDGLYGSLRSMYRS